VTSEATEIALTVEPDEDDPRFATLLVDGDVDGEVRRFVLDTGASRTHVVLAEGDPRLGEGFHRSSGVFESARQRVAHVDSLSVGPIGGTSIEVVAVDPNQRGARNLLGMDLLGQHRLRIEIGPAKLVVEPSGAGDAIHPLWLDPGRHPFVDIRWAHVQARCVVDTGAGTTVVDEAFARRHPEGFSLAGVTVGTDGTGAQVETPVVEMAPFELGGMRFPAHLGVLVDLSGPNSTLEVPMDMILGYTTLLNADWIFDFPASRWGFAS